MPRYTYECDTYECHEPPLSVELTRASKDRDLPVKCVSCGFDMKRGLSKTSPATVKERVDSHRNIHQRADNDRRIRDRAKKFFVENEMADQIAKEGVEEAKKKGWVKPDGTVVKKEDLK